MGCLCGYLSEARCTRFIYRPADANYHPIISCFIKIQNGLPFTQVVLEKRQLNEMELNDIL